MNKPFYKKISIEIDENNCSFRYIEQKGTPVPNPTVYGYKSKRRSNQPIPEFYKEAYKALHEYLTQIETEIFVEEFKKVSEA